MVDGVTVPLWSFCWKWSPITSKGRSIIRWRREFILHKLAVLAGKWKIWMVASSPNQNRDLDMQSSFLILSIIFMVVSAWPPAPPNPPMCA
jgi:hypothetical protein